MIVMAYNIKFFDSVRFMLSSLSSLADNLAGLHNSIYKDCKSCLEYIKVKDNLINTMAY